MILFSWIAGAILAVISLAVGYLYLLGLVGAFGRKSYRATPTHCRTLLLVPAFNEADGISTCLESLNSVETHGDLRIVIVADNCTDNTVDVARLQGFEVLERCDPDRRGKGQALCWALEQFDIAEYDSVLVVDADTVVEPSIIKAIAASLASGAGAVQLYNEVVASEDTRLAQLQHIANAVENRLFWHGRNVAGLPVLLRGTGMAVSTETLRKHPWQPTSITEDIEYSVSLLHAGVKIDFCCESVVRSAAASSYNQCHTQKDRWFFGMLSSIRYTTLPLIRNGLRRLRPGMLELAASQFLLSRPTLGYVTLSAMFLSLFGRGDFLLTALMWGSVLLTLLILYILSGIFFVADKGSALKGLVHIPYYSLWFMFLQLRTLFSSRKRQWVRTERIAVQDSQHSKEIDPA